MGTVRFEMNSRFQPYPTLVPTLTSVYVGHLETGDRKLAEIRDFLKMSAHISRRSSKQGSQRNPHI